ncbi:MAG: precorrin-3B C(17)-methyltransferase [Lachnospiraceae bacterium]|nr:precorrin-3B C(17)-methyltransferase [Lachnospiraceae bacterium]
MKKRIDIIGMGPGSLEGMTLEAKQALDACDVIVGYTKYVELLMPYFPQKEVVTTGMRQEIERCRACYDLASQGKHVAFVCSGDAGVYGMAAPVFELLPEYETEPGYEGIEIGVIAGVTAANSGAAILGAPLNHDYCVISLSDLLTPWETIENRLRAAILGDFAIAIYNPASHKRADYLKRACEIMLDAGASPDRACGFVKNIGREGTQRSVCTLRELADADADMFTTVFIGNSQSEIRDGRLITKRGYSI